MAHAWEILQCEHDHVTAGPAGWKCYLLFAVWRERWWPLKRSGLDLRNASRTWYLILFVYQWQDAHVVIWTLSISLDCPFVAVWTWEIIRNIQPIKWDMFLKLDDGPLRFSCHWRTFPWHSAAGRRLFVRYVKRAPQRKFQGPTVLK